MLAMRVDTVLVDPSPACPFFVEALKYTPSSSYEDGYTFLMMHAINLHKETFHSFLKELLENPRNSDLRVKDVWVIGMSLQPLTSGKDLIIFDPMQRIQTMDEVRL